MDVKQHSIQVLDSENTHIVMNTQQTNPQSHHLYRVEMPQLKNKQIYTSFYCFHYWEHT